MGLFDFFKPKKKPVELPTQVPSARMECDVSKTALIAVLFKVAHDKRDTNWHQSFYENVATASFVCASPQVLTGPDGFPYFILKTPEENKPFESFCIQNMKDDFLLKNGWGVVFNPTETSADWVFTYGNIVNLHLHNQFFTPTDDDAIKNIEFTKTVGVLKKEEQVLIAQPSETFLPKYTRQALSKFLQSKGIKQPKVMMLCTNENGKVLQKLAFNIHPEDFPEVSKLDYLMQLVGWFLPSQYIIIPLPKKSSLGKDLKDL